MYSSQIEDSPIGKASPLGLESTPLGGSIESLLGAVSPLGKSPALSDDPLGSQMWVWDERLILKYAKKWKIGGRIVLSGIQRFKVTVCGFLINMKCQD